MAELVFFASIREEIGCEKLILDIPDDISVSDLVTLLGDSRGEAWRNSLSAENVRVAVNQELIAGNPRLSNGDEIAFFPPVTGG